MNTPTLWCDNCIVYLTQRHS